MESCSLTYQISTSLYIQIWSINTSKMSITTIADINLDYIGWSRIPQESLSLSWGSLMIR